MERSVPTEGVKTTGAVFKDQWGTIMPEGSIRLEDLRQSGAYRINRIARDRERPIFNSELAIAMLVSDCVRRLAESDILVEQTTDFEYAMATIETLDKPCLTEYMSPMKNDFFESNCFWLILTDQEGQPGGMLGARCDDSGREPLSSYACRKLRNIFPEEHEIPVDPMRLPRIADEISGRIVYAGDLYLSRSFRTTNLQVLRTVVVLMYCLMFLKWKELDWIYAFKRDRDVARGAAWLYQFTRNYPMAHSWTKPPSDKSGENWLAAMTRAELVDLLSSYLAAPNRL